MRLPAFLPETDWSPPAVSSLPMWKDAKRISFDLETRDPDLRSLGPGVRTNGYIVGAAVAIEDGPSFYLPVRHQGGGNLDQEQVFAWLRDNAREFKGSVVGANLQYDMDYSWEQDIVFPHARWRDVQVAEPLLDELQISYSLDNIAKRHFLPGKDETLLRKFADYYGVDPKTGLWMLPSKAVGAYGEQDVRLPLQLIRRQERQIEEEGLWDIYDTECRLQPVLMKMRRRGVKIDFDKLEYIERLSVSRETKALAEIRRLTGFKLTTDDTTKSSALIPVVRHLGFRIPRTAPTDRFPDGQDSLTNDYLKTLDHPVCDLIREAKKWNKLRNTFCASIKRHSVNGRIHCTFNQMIGEDEGSDDAEGARYGRLSCKQPNLQQQPSRDPEIGPLWRSIYVPDDGGIWACLDYSQQEPRWLTHFAELLDLPKAKEAAELYRNDPTTDNHQMMADLCSIERKPAKEIYLGVCYGMGGGKMATKLGLPTVQRVHSKSKRSYLAAGPECQALIDAFDKGAPYVKALAKIAENRAKRRGWIRTAGGRKCRFPRKRNGQFDWCHKALNRLIQGSSGDQTKKAMVLVDEEGFDIQLQVHDELDQTVEKRGVAEDIAEIMRYALPCNVPAKVDVETGPNWGEVA